MRPYLNESTLQVVPQVPAGQPSVAGSNVDATRTLVHELVIGHTLPRGSRPTEVRLDGRRVRHYDARVTNRGLELTVSVRSQAQHTLTITTV